MGGTYIVYRIWI